MNDDDGHDDGSRAYAVRELGEQAVREAEVELVRANAGVMSVGMLRAMGIPASSIREGLGLDVEGAPRRAALWPPGVSTGRPEELGNVAVGSSHVGPGVAR